MALRINSEAPNFTAETTQGPIKFHDWIGEGWAILFSHPKDFTPVCTTELGYMAGLKPEFDKRNCKIIGLSVDPVTDHQRWAKDIEETQGHAVNYPMIGDPELKVAKAYDMLPEESGTTSQGRTAADNATVRSVFVIGPDKKVKAMLTYPMSTGRNFDEVVRILDSLPAHGEAQGGHAGELEAGAGRHHRARRLRRGREEDVSRRAGSRPSPTCASSPSRSSRRMRRAGGRPPGPPARVTMAMRLPDRAVELAEALLREARAQQTADERAQSRKLARMMADPHGKELTIALADQAFRSHRPERIADQLAYLLERYGVPQYMDWWERVALLLGGAMAHYLPSLVVPPIVARLRHETQNVILPGEEEDLRRYIEERRRAGLRLNLNQLGEAILGEAEAARRLEAYLGAAGPRRRRVHLGEGLLRVQPDRPRRLSRHGGARGRAAAHALPRRRSTHHYRHPDGRVTPKFINLDMEEYRDLDLTVTAFREVLDEPEFLPLSAGIVLQAYLPDSHRVQRALTAWALARRARGGAPVKLRIVKGANLAMERIEAAVHGWPQAPYETKAEVDANYKRMVEYGSRPEHAEAVHLGVASHNLFDIAYGLVLREDRHVEPWVEFEMLEGHGQSPGAGGAGARRGPAALRARRPGGGFPQRHRLPGPPAGREHRARELPAPRLRPGARLARLDRRARSLPGRVRARGGPVRRAPPHPGSGRGSGGPARPPSPRRAVRERSRHRLDAGGQPRLDRRGRGPLARAAAGGRSRSRSGASSAPARGSRTGAIPRGPAASPIATRWAAPPTWTGR